MHSVTLTGDECTLLRLPAEILTITLENGTICESDVPISLSICNGSCPSYDSSEVTLHSVIMTSSYLAHHFATIAFNSTNVKKNYICKISMLYATEMSCFLCIFQVYVIDTTLPTLDVVINEQHQKLCQCCTGDGDVIDVDAVCDGQSGYQFRVKQFTSCGCVDCVSSSDASGGGGGSGRRRRSIAELDATQI